MFLFYLLSGFFSVSLLLFFSFTTTKDKRIRANGLFLLVSMDFKLSYFVMCTKTLNTSEHQVTTTFTKSYIWQTVVHVHFYREICVANFTIYDQIGYYHHCICIYGVMFLKSLQRTYFICNKDLLLVKGFYRNRKRCIGLLVNANCFQYTFRFCCFFLYLIWFAFIFCFINSINIVLNLLILTFIWSSFISIIEQFFLNSFYKFIGLLLWFSHHGNQ